MAAAATRGRTTGVDQGRSPSFNEVPFKTIRAITAPSATHKVPVTGKTSAPVLISAGGQERLMVPPHDFDEFEELSGQLEKILEASHLAKLDLSHAVESQKKSDVEAAEKALGLAKSK